MLIANSANANGKTLSAIILEPRTVRIHAISAQETLRSSRLTIALVRWNCVQSIVRQTG